MGAADVLAGLLIIILNITKLPAAVGLIVKSAFKPPALAGGAVGVLAVCLCMAAGNADRAEELRSSGDGKETRK